MAKESKDMNLNVRLPKEDYEKLKQIADDLGGISLSSMMRMLIYAKIEEVEYTGDSKVFLNIRKTNKRKK